METSPESAILPYLNPAYWDGRMVGQPNLDRVTRHVEFGQSRLAERLVTDYLAHRRAPYPLETFKAGDEIDAKAYAPGTIFYGNRESMVVNGELPLLDTPWEAPAEIEPPTDTGFELISFDEDRGRGFSRQYLLQVDNVRYTAMRSFLVVTAKHNLQPVNEYTLYRMEDGSIFSGSGVVSIDAPFTVGLTRHTKIGSHSQLHRVNTLMLSHEGRPAKSTSLSKILSNLGLNPFANTQ